MSTAPASSPAAGNGAPVLTREEKLALCASRIVRSEGVPPFSSHAREVIARSADPNLALTDMTRTIIKDVGLSSHVLRVANSMLYNRSGKPILSVSHGVSLLGSDTLREHVSAMRFIEHYLHRSPGLRELAAMSLLSANHGRQVAAHVGYPLLEEAYICSLFANLGEILVARYCPAEYARALVAVRDEGIGEHQACLRNLGYSWHDLAARVSTLWNMPEKVRICIESRELREPARRGLEGCLCSIAVYSHALTSSIYRGLRRPLPLEHAVLDPNGRKVQLSRDDVAQVVAVALEDTAVTLEALHVPREVLKLEKQAEQAQKLLDSGALADQPAGPELRSPAKEDARAAVGRSLAELREALEAHPFDVGAFINGVLSALYGCGSFSRVIFALVTQNRDSIQGRLGAGEDIDGALASFSFPLHGHDVLFTTTLTRRQDTVVRRDKDGRFDRSRLVTALGPRMFGFFPVIADGLAVGCLYVDSLKPGAALPDWMMPHLGAGRTLIASALERVRARSAPLEGCAG